MVLQNGVMGTVSEYALSLKDFADALGASETVSSQYPHRQSIYSASGIQATDLKHLKKAKLSLRILFLEHLVYHGAITETATMHDGNKRSTRSLSLVDGFSLEALPDVFCGVEF